MTALTTKDDITYSLPAVSADKINAAAVAKVNAYLPIAKEKQYADQIGEQIADETTEYIALNIDKISE